MDVLMVHVFHGHGGTNNDASLKGRYIVVMKGTQWMSPISSLGREGLFALMLPIGQLGSCPTVVGGRLAGVSTCPAPYCTLHYSAVQYVLYSALHCTAMHCIAQH